MKKYIKIGALLILVLLVSSCNNKKTLQEYFVESQEKTAFIAFGIPFSFLELKSAEISDEEQATLKSIRKVNVVALPIKGNEAAYEVEKATLKNIFSNTKKYKSLFSMKIKGANVYLYYTGHTSAVKEVIVFGYGKEVGVGIARLLGENMNPAKIVKMMKSVDINEEALNLDQLSAFFKGK